MMLPLLRSLAMVVAAGLSIGLTPASAQSAAPSAVQAPAPASAQAPAPASARTTAPAPAQAAAPPSAKSAGPAPAQAAAPVILVVGDSISAGYGLPKGEVWVDLLAARLAAERYPQRVVNASITGDTTAGGRARLAALLAQHKPAVVVIELGGNDALRGGRLATTRENLDAMVTAAQAAGARVLLIGMQLPPNYGPAYVREFGEVFDSVAKARKVPLVPAFFAGFGEDLAYFQPDKIHPTADAQPKLLANVWPALQPLLRK